MRASALFFVLAFACLCQNAAQEKKDDRKFVPPPPPVYPDPPPPPTPTKKVKQMLSTSTGYADVELVSAKIDTLDYERKTVSGLKNLEVGKRLIVRVRVTNIGDKKLVYTPWHSDDKGSASAKDESGQRYEAWHGGIGSRPTGGLWQKTTIAPKKSIEDVIAFGEPLFAAEEITFTLPGVNVGASSKLTFRMDRAFFDDEPARRKVIAQQFEDAKKAHALRVAAMKADYEAKVAKAKEEFDTLPMRLEKERLAKVAAEKEAKEKAELEAKAKEAASRTGMFGALKVEIIDGGVGKVTVHDDLRGSNASSKEPCTWIKVRITNTSDTELTYYESWSGKDFSRRQDATLNDDVGNKYPQITWGLGTKAVGQITRRTRVENNKSITDILVFDSPVPKAAEFRLTLPGRNLREEGSITFTIPRKFLKSTYEGQ
jgi:hypothetical protein